MHDKKIRFKKSDSKNLIVLYGYSFNDSDFILSLRGAYIIILYIMLYRGGTIHISNAQVKMVQFYR